MTRAGVEPNVHNICFLDESCTSAAALKPWRNQIAGISGKPDIGTVFTEQLLNVTDSLGSNNYLAAVLAVKSGNRHSPGSLPGNAPVSPVSNHIVHSLLAPGGNPLYIFHFLKQFLAESFDRGKPLLSCPENNGVLASPAVRILVLEEIQMQQAAVIL